LAVREADRAGRGGASWVAQPSAADLDDCYARSAPRASSPGGSAAAGSPHCAGSGIADSGITHESGCQHSRCDGGFTGGGARTELGSRARGRARAARETAAPSVRGRCEAQTFGDGQDDGCDRFTRPSARRPTKKTAWFPRPAAYDLGRGRCRTRADRSADRRGSPDGARARTQGSSNSRPPRSYLLPMLFRCCDRRAGDPPNAQRGPHRSDRPAGSADPWPSMRYARDAARGSSGSAHTVVLLARTGHGSGSIRDTAGRCSPNLNGAHRDPPAVAGSWMANRVEGQRGPVMELVPTPPDGCRGSRRSS